MGTPKKNTAHYPLNKRSCPNKGDLILFIDMDLLSGWDAVEQTGRRGRPRKYSDGVMELARVVADLFELPLRQTQQVVAWLLRTIGMGHLPVPDYSVISRRRRQVLSDAEPRFSHTESANGPVELLLDPSGIRRRTDEEGGKGTDAGPTADNYRLLQLRIKLEERADGTSEVVLTWPSALRS